MLIHSLLTTMALAVSQAAAAPADAVIDKCDVAAIQDLTVPASDPGVLIRLGVDAGVAVRKGAELATIDDREAQAQFKVKELEYQIAKQTADSDVELRNAKNAEKLAKIAHDKYEYIRNRELNAVTEIDYLQRKFEWEKAQLSIEKNQEDAKSHRLTADSKKAEADAAKVALDRRTLIAPFDGVVVKTYAQVGEWLQPGEPVVQVMRIDKLRVYGNLDASKWTRSDIDGRKVTVEVMLPRGREVKVIGKIVFVSPVVGVGGKLPVWAEIDTPMERGLPLVSAGMEARMIIHTNQLAPTASRPAAPATTRSASNR